MAVYQVPQFLDSGDKIVFGMTVWQLVYAMAGFFLSLGMFSLVSGALPFLGIWSAIPVLPIAALAIYLSLGKFNGRDSDIYILKFILMLVRPRKMVYQRQPDNYDLDEKLAKLTVENIEKEWESRLVKAVEQQKDTNYDFRGQQAEQKARIIREMGSHLDDTFNNTMAAVSRASLQIEAKQDFLEKLDQQRVQSGTGWNKFMQNQQQAVNQQTSSNQQPINLPAFQPIKIKDYIAEEVNFFDLNKDGKRDA